MALCEQGTVGLEKSSTLVEKLVLLQSQPASVFICTPISVNSYTIST